MTFIFILLVLHLCDSKVYIPEKGISQKQAFEEYVSFWNKTHHSQAEKMIRFHHFKINSKKIEDLNKNRNNAKFGYTQFSDLSAEEFKSQMTGHKNKKKETKIDNSREKRSNQLEIQQAPNASIDWVAKNMTTPIKNQGDCGSCWAFSATEAIESAILLAGKKVQLGSPQMIVDCDGNEDGCGGGDGREAMQWVISEGGQDTESCYPYTGSDGTCAMSSCKPTNKISSVTAIDSDEGEIYTALQTSPLAICCDASAWQNYEKWNLDC